VREACAGAERRMHALGAVLEMSSAGWESGRVGRYMRAPREGHAEMCRRSGK
jgi:hypothetical protein